MKALHRILLVFLAALMVSAVMLPALAADGGAESQFVNKINAERKSRGLNTLQVHGGLTNGARAHSQRMMNQGNLHHNPNLGSVVGGWDALGENVGVGPNVNVLHSAFMSSSAHRNNILGQYTHVGVGVVRENGNKIWVTVIFMRQGNAPAPTPTTTTTAPSPTPTTTTTAPPPPPPPTTTTTTTPPPPAPDPGPAPAPAPTPPKKKTPPRPPRADVATSAPRAAAAPAATAPRTFLLLDYPCRVWSMSADLPAFGNCGF